MEGDEDVTEEDVDGGTANGSSKRARLGRDGKPRPPPRGLKRRGSEDIERDKAVEEILREARRTYHFYHVVVQGQCRLTSPCSTRCLRHTTAHAAVVGRRRRQSGGGAGRGRRWRGRRPHCRAVPPRVPRGHRAATAAADGADQPTKSQEGAQRGCPSRSQARRQPQYPCPDARYPACPGEGEETVVELAREMEMHFVFGL